MSTSNYLKKLEELKARAYGTSGENNSSNESVSSNKGSGSSSQSVLDRIKARADGTDNVTPTISSQGMKGWQKYLDDQEAAKNAPKHDLNNDGKDSWWETFLGYLGGNGGGVVDTTMPTAGVTQTINDLRADESYKRPNDDWNDSQRAEFGVLYLENPSKAYEYAERTNNANNKAKEEAKIKEVQDSATSGFWAGAGHTVGAIASAPLGMADFLSDLAYANAGRDIAPDGQVSPFEYSQAVTGGISEHLNEKGGTFDEDIPIIGGKGWGDVYGLGTSIAQSMVSAYTLGPVGTLVSYFGQGAASGVDEALSRGASDEQAMLYGTALGVFEGLAEMVGVDKLFKLGSSSTIKGFIKNILSQAGAEGAEEGLTSLLSNIADNVIMQDKSNFNFLVAQYMAQDMNESEAKFKAWMDSVEGIAFDTIAGAISGGVSGSVHTTAQNFASNINAKKTYGDGADLVTEALDIDADNTYAQKMQAKLDKGKNLSGGQINRLVETNEQTLLKQDTAKMKSAVESRLTELGESGDISKLADVIVKTQSGGKLTSAERSALVNSKYGRRVSTELNPKSIESGEYTSSWAENIGTERINEKAYNKDLYDLATKQTGTDLGKRNLSLTKNPTSKEIVTEGKFKASESGKTKIGDTEVSIKEIASIKNGEMMLRLEDDSTVNASDVEYSSNEEGLLYENVVHMGLNAATANAFVNGYDGSMPVAEYALDFRQAYRYGEIGIPKSELSSEGFSSRLTDSQKSLAYDLGSTDAKYKASEKEKIASTSSIKYGKDSQKTSKKGKLHNTLTPTNETQRASLKTLGMLAETLGIDIYTFESPLVNGKRQGANGWYDPTDNSIHIDLYAGNDGKGTMLFTAAHELTHHIREMLPAKFKVFADFLFERYGEKGVSVSELIEKRIGELEANGRTKGLTDAQIYDRAYEEVVADACESFLADGEAVAKIAELKAKDKTLWQTIKDFLAKLVARIKEAYKGLSPDSIEGRYVAEMLDSAEKLKAMWTEMLVEASEISNIVEIDTNTQSVSPMFSERTWTASEYVTEREKTAKAISKALNVDIKTAYKYIDDINSVARLIADDRARLDYEPNLDEKATVLKPNSDYKYSVDMSTLCAKRLLFTGTFDAIQRALPNMVFDSEDIVSLREMMQKRGYEVACGICYVESTRREIGRITQDFINSYKESQKTGKPMTRINSSGKVVDLKKTNEQKATTVDKSTDKFFAEKDYTPTLADLNTTDIDLVKRDHPLVYEAYLNFMNTRGQAKPKLLETRAEYKGEILKHFKAKNSVEARNNAGGLRLQSFSDFEVPHMIDMMQIVMDMSRVGLMSQAYTKVPAFAEIFGDTGVKINLSLIAKGDGLDSNGNLIFDDVEGINHKEAFKLRDKYSKNVGTILVGKTDAHIIAAMADPRIDYIIPFHKSSWKESLYDALGLTGYADYTDTQNEKPIDKDRKIKNFEPSEYWDFTKSGDENAQIYLEKCRKDGRIPKFPQFQGYPGYWKLLIDFKMYDNDGIGSPQEVVRPTFNTEASERILGEYKGGHKSFPVAKDVVEDFVKEHKDKVKYSDRDSLAKKQENVTTETDTLDNNWDREYNLYNTTIDFIRQAPYGMPREFPRSLANKTTGMTEGEIRTIYVCGYIVEADGYMHGRILAPYNEKTKNLLHERKVEYGKIDENRSGASVWSQAVRYAKRGSGSNIGVSRRRRPSTDDRLLGTSPRSNASGNNERVRATFETKEEIDEIVKKLREIFGLDDNKHSDSATEEKLYSDRNYSEGLSEADKEVADNVISRLKEQKMFAKYYRAFATYTEKRINDEIAWSMAQYDPDYAQTYITWVEPIDYIYATTATEAWREQLAKEAGDLDKERLAKETQPIYLTVDFETGKIKGHEGRHRMIALEKAGVEKVAVIIISKNDQYWKTKPIEVMKLEGQDFGDYKRGTGFFLHNMLPLSERYADVAREMFSFDSRDGLRFSDRNSDSVSNRSLLANALESVAQNDIERNKLKEYKNKIALIESEQAKLAETRAKIKELSFATGRRDTEKIKSLQFEANQSANRINTYDRQLLNLEATAALKGVLEKEKQMAYKKAEKKGKEALAKQRERNAKSQRELLTRYQESRKKGVEGRRKTEMRYKIKTVVNDLNQYLLKGTKEKHVPIELQGAVAEALASVNMDTVGAEERIAKKRAEMMVAKTPEAIEKLAKEIAHIEEMGGNMEAKLSRLKTAYDSIINSDDPLIANSHDEVISNSIDKVIEIVGNTPIRDMSLYQLEAVYDMYRMVLTTIRKANKAFKQAKGEEISTIANGVIAELDEQKKSPMVVKGLNKLSEFAWNNLKPIYAFERIGSANFTKVFNAVRAGEDVWAKDMSEAQAFREEQYKKHGYDSFDFDKKYDFVSSTGRAFTLNLGQIMSLYAYSKRGSQAKEHLKYGGFQFDGITEIKEKKGKVVNVTYQLKDTSVYKISDELLDEIIGVLDKVKGAKTFVDEMQEYLSSTMGEKGNEVSLEMYEVKLFKEKNYFPLKVSHDFLARAREQAQGDVKIKNSGFTKEVKPNAKNPIVLSSFMDVWAGHVNEMSMYHAFTLPLEDFYRVFNYGTPTDEKLDTISVVSSLRGAHRDGAVNYIDQLLKDLNGGARSDPRETLGKTMMSNFKKASVMASLSVVVQQPTAMVRAMALVDSKYFVGKPTMTKHSESWAEVKKYAPIAVIKEMGYFDTGMGKGSVEWLKGEKTFMDKVDDAVTKAPALADELTWVAIWKAVKRETLHTHKHLKPNSDAFLKAVGERFTEVIVKTQVYDSTLARSANMRSKSGLMNMWTAFMAEPTTSINMLQDAFRKGKSRKYRARVIGAVYGSVVLNSALVSLIYAMRDDDEDETFLEKYLSRFTTEVLDGINPLTYIPLVKDIWSAAQGFDIERSDMSLITALFDSLQQTIKVIGKDTSDMDEDELSEHKKSVAESLMSIVDNISSLVGVPVKNVRRDINGIINFFNTSKKDLTERDSTAGSLGDNILEDVKDSVPVWGWFPDESKGDKLYDAIIKGDTDYIDRLKGSYKSENAYNSAIRKALRENDSRIEEAATAVVNGDFEKYTEIFNTIVGEGNFSKKEVKSAIDSAVGDMTEDKETTDSGVSKEESIYEMDYIFTEILDGDVVMAHAMKEDIIRTAIANGKDRDEAETSFNNSFTSGVKKRYEEGDITDGKAKSILVNFGGKTEIQATSKIQYWDYTQDNPGISVSESWFVKYNEEIATSGIHVDVYIDYKLRSKGIEGEGKEERLMDVINSLPISSSQKDALYFAEDWASSRLYEAPWH